MIELPKIAPPDAPAVAAPPRAAPTVRKLARSQTRAFTIAQAQRQKMRCPLCMGLLDTQTKGAMVLDHDHNTGLIRGVLCRACNGAEGKVANAAGRWGARSMEYSAIIAFLERLLVYLRKPALPVVYPLHKTEDERRLERNKKAREQRAQKAARQRIKANK